MKLPEAVKQIRTAYVAKFPVPQATPETIDELARAWSIRFAEQVAFQLGPSFGVKRADPGRPICKDCIAQQVDRLVIWDQLKGTGTGKPTIIDDPESVPDEEAAGQVFVPVTPKNHLGTEPQPDPDPEPTPDPSFEKRIAALEIAVTQLQRTDMEQAAENRRLDKAINDTNNSVAAKTEALGVRLSAQEARKIPTKAKGRLFGIANVELPLE